MLSLKFQAVGAAAPQTELKPMETFASPYYFKFLYNDSLWPKKLKTQYSNQGLCLAAHGPILRGKPKKDG